MLDSQGIKDSSYPAIYHIGRRKGVKNMKTHYHVLQGMQGGYLPDENYMAMTLKEARNIAAELARTWREEFHEYEENIWGPSYKVSGSCKSGFYQIEQRPYNPTSLGWYVEIVECEEDCEEDEYGEQ